MINIVEWKLTRGQKFHSSACNYKWNLERTSNPFQSTHPVGRITRGSHITPLCFFIAYAFKGKVHVFAGQVKVLQDKCNIEIFLSPVKSLFKELGSSMVVCFLSIYLSIYLLILKHPSRGLCAGPKVAGSRFTRGSCVGSWFNTGRQEIVPKWLKNCWLEHKALTQTNLLVFIFVADF